MPHQVVILHHLPDRVSQRDGHGQRQTLRYSHYQHSYTDNEELQKFLDVLLLPALVEGPLDRAYSSLGQERGVAVTFLVYRVFPFYLGRFSWDIALLLAICGRLCRCGNYRSKKRIFIALERA